MKAVANVLIGLVALSHVGFLVLEMFFWDHPVGRRIFGMTPEVSASSATLAANQGLYNGFLAGAFAPKRARKRRWGERSVSRRHARRRRAGSRRLPPIAQGAGRVRAVGPL